MWNLDTVSAGTLTTPAGSLAQLRLATPGPCPQVAELVERDAAAPVRGELRGRLARGPALKRYARLRREAEALAKEERAAAATLNRIAAERAELLETAPPGFSARLAELDRLAGELEARRESLRLSAAAVVKPTEAARQSAVAAFADLAHGLHEAALEDARRRRAEAMARLGEALQLPLTQLAAADAAAALAVGRGLAGDSVATVEALAAADEEG